MGQLLSFSCLRISLRSLSGFVLVFFSFPHEISFPNQTLSFKISGLLSCLQAYLLILLCKGSFCSFSLVAG